MAFLSSTYFDSRSSRAASNASAESSCSSSRVLFDFSPSSALPRTIRPTALVTTLAVNGSSASRGDALPRAPHLFFRLAFRLQSCEDFGTNHHERIVDMVVLERIDVYGAVARLRCLIQFCANQVLPSPQAASTERTAPWGSRAICEVSLLATFSRSKRSPENGASGRVNALPQIERGKTRGGFVTHLVVRSLPR